MATIGAAGGLRWLLLSLFSAALLSTPAVSADAQADAARRAAPVAYYDADVVLRTARVFTDERNRLVALTERRDAEVSALRDEVIGLRESLKRAKGLPDPERRTLEARLAHATIALLVARTEATREVARANDELLERLESRIIPAVAHVAQERGIGVVVRAGAGTSVLDDDALDLTPLVIDTLEGSSADAPHPSRPSERRRTRIQSCDAAVDEASGAATR